MTIVEPEIAHLDPDNNHNAVPALIWRRITGTFPIDEWGFDPDIASLTALLTRLRWSAEVVGEQYIPEIGSALVVHNSRFQMGESLLVSDALGRASSRPVRFSGVPDMVMVGPVLRRMGGVPGGLDDLRVLLRAGELVSVALARELTHPFHAGPAPIEAIGVALAQGAPVLPVAISGFEPGRHRRIVIGEPITTRRRVGVVTAEELAATVRARVQDLLTSGR